MIRLTVSGWLVCMMMVGVAAAAAPVPAVEVKPSAPPTAIEKALDQPIDIDFEMTSLDNVLKWVADVKKDLKLSIDPAVAAAGIDLSTRLIDLKIKHIAVRDLLDLILGEDLWCKIEADHVLITTAEKALQFQIVSYPVKDILDRIIACEARGVGSAPPSRMIVESTPTVRAQADLSGAIKVLIDPAADPKTTPWGGKDAKAGSLECVGDALVVRQTAVTQRRVAELLDMLRQAFTAQPLPASGPASSPKQAAITLEPKSTADTRRRLQEAMDLDFEKTGLDNVLKYLGEIKKDLNIVLDPETRSDGIDLSTCLVDLKVKNLAIAHVLDLILQPHLGYRVGPGYVLVTTRKRLERTLPLTAYPVLDLILPFAGRLPGGGHAMPPEAGGPMIFRDFIFRLFNPEAYDEMAEWSDSGGPAEAVFLGGVMLVSQTPRGQERIADLLARIREVVLAAAEEVKAQQKGAAPELLTVLPDRASPPKGLIATRKMLEKPIKADFEASTVPVILKFLAEQQPGLNIVISLQIANAGLDIEEMVVTYRAAAKPLGEVLAAVLGDKLDYVVKPGYVLVVPRSPAGSELVIEAYAVTDRLAGPAAQRMPVPERFALPLGPKGEFSWPELVALIRRNVAPATDSQVAKWGDHGWPASLDMIGGVLVVRQTRRGHEKVVETLNQLIRDRFRPVPKDPLGPL
jgi:hypothetical protein